MTKETRGNTLELTNPSNNSKIKTMTAFELVIYEREHLKKEEIDTMLSNIQ